MTVTVELEGAGEESPVGVALPDTDDTTPSDGDGATPQAMIFPEVVGAAVTAAVAEAEAVHVAEDVEDLAGEVDALAEKTALAAGMTVAMGEALVEHDRRLTALETALAARPVAVDTDGDGEPDAVLPEPVAEAVVEGVPGRLGRPPRRAFHEAYFGRVGGGR